jgi:ABC-type bacteriocin/lantibiotic exporter with double-glycine peptidase domain
MMGESASTDMKTTPLKHVRQIERTECGAACVAILAGVSLAKARTLLGQSSEDKNNRTSTEDIRAALAKLQIRLGRENYCTSWEKIDAKLQRGLLAVSDKNIGEPNQTWHWVVYDRVEGESPILDPQSKLERRKPGRLRAYSYFYVYYS